VQCKEERGGEKERKRKAELQERRRDR